MGVFPARPARRLVAAAGVTIVLAGVLVTAAATQLPSTTDPRVGLAAGLDNPGVAATGLELLAHRNKPAGFFDPNNPGSFGFVNSDLAFQGNSAFVGNFNGFQIYDISDRANPTLRTAVVCPGGQGEVSVYGNLLFMSVEESRGRVDCGTNPQVGTRFQGVRVFDISNLDAPVQVAAVQTCRGSHTHTLLKSPADDANLYVYVSGTAGVRPASTLAGCVNAPATNPDTSLWRIEVIRVPLATPENAAVVNMVRLFADSTTGAINGLQNAPPTPQHPSGMNWGPTPITDACHDITTYPAIGLAAGACEGNGLLIDISDPANPARIDAVADPNYAYWHGATFSNDGTKVVFTDEWGGGTAARCRGADPVTGRQPDRLDWGANAIFDIVDRKLVFRSYYKMPAVQTNQENCVAHLPSLIPVPGRDILVQAWYQAGASVMEFTDSANPKEIAYYDRGPISGTSLVLGGLWSAYYYDGAVYGSEIARGFDAWKLTPNAELSQNEIDAAAEVAMDRLTPQHQPKLVNQPSFAVTRSYVDQLVRADDIPTKTLAQVTKFIDRAERFMERGQIDAARDQLRALASQLKGEQYADLRAALLALANASGVGVGRRRPPLPASGATVSVADHPFHGPIHHLGYVVEDLEATVDRLVGEVGAGPFIVLRDVQFEQVTSRGEPATFQHDSAFVQCGSTPIEVMQLKRLEPERVRAGFSQPPPQLHHTAYVVAPERLAEAREELERRGLPAFLHATLGDIDATYHEAAHTIGHQVELHADSRGLRDFFALIHSASIGWDGSDPLRSAS